MLLERLLDRISVIVPGGALSGKRLEALSSLNPDKMYVENIRSVLGVSHDTALKICETAVRQGLFQKRIEVMCPDGAVAASAKTDEELPDMVKCWKEEDGDIEEVELPTDSLSKTWFYRFNETSSVHHY